MQHMKQSRDWLLCCPAVRRGLRSLPTSLLAKLEPSMLLLGLVATVAIEALDPDISLFPSCSYVQQYEPDDPKTHAGRNLERMSMRQLYEAFGLQETTIDFVVRAPICRGNLRLSMDALFQLTKALETKKPTQCVHRSSC